MDDPSFVLIESKTDPAYLTLQRIIPQDEIKAEANINNDVSSDTVQVHVSMEVIPEQTGKRNETDPETTKYLAEIGDGIKRNKKSTSFNDGNIQFHPEDNKFKNNSKAILEGERISQKGNRDSSTQKRPSSSKAKNDSKKFDCDRTTQENELAQVSEVNKKEESIVIEKDTIDQALENDFRVAQEHQQFNKCKTKGNLNGKSTNDEIIVLINGRQSKEGGSLCYDSYSQEQPCTKHTNIVKGSKSLNDHKPGHKFKIKFSSEHGRMFDFRNKIYSSSISHPIQDTNKSSEEECATDNDDYDNLTDWTIKYSGDIGDDSNAIKGIVLPPSVTMTDEEQLHHDYNSQNLVSTNDGDCDRSSSTNIKLSQEDVLRSTTRNKVNSQDVRLKHKSEPGSSVSDYNRVCSSQNKPRSKSECYDDDMNLQNVTKRCSEEPIWKHTLRNAKYIANKPTHNISIVSETNDKVEKPPKFQNELKNS